MNNLPKVVAQHRRGRASNPRLLDRKSDALPLSHRATQMVVSDNKTKFRTRFNPHITGCGIKNPKKKTDKTYEIALVNLETYYSFPDVD